MTNKNIQEAYKNYITESVNSDEINLRELLLIFWRGKWLVLLIALIFSSIAFFYSMNLPNIYKSEGLVAPASDSNSGNGGLSALAGQFGGLASLAGLNLSGGSVDKIQLAIEVIKSREFISNFITKHEILPELMAAKSWDLATNTINFDHDIYNYQDKTWVRVVSPPLKSSPSMQEAYLVFKKTLNIELDTATGLITISIENISPFLAQQWVSWIIKDINTTMKDRDVEEAKRSVNFLELQIEKTNVSDIRSVLYKLIEEQTKTIMFANARDEFVFKTIDPAIVPLMKEGPKRTVIVICGGVLGLLFGFITVWLKDYLVKEK